MRTYNTYGKANAEYGKLAGGKYLVLHYKERTGFDHYGSRKYGVWYKCRWFENGKYAGDGYDWYELFQVGPRGGIKRLNQRIHVMAEDVPVLETGHPASLTAVRWDSYEYRIKVAFLNAVLDEIPEIFIEEQRKAREEALRSSKEIAAKWEAWEKEQERQRKAEKERQETERQRRRPVATNLGALMKQAGFNW